MPQSRSRAETLMEQQHLSAYDYVDPLDFPANAVADNLLPHDKNVGEIFTCQLCGHTLSSKLDLETGICDNCAEV